MDLLTIYEAKLIARYKAKHNDCYDYSKFKYLGNKEKSIFICKEHGEFKQYPYSHAHNGCGKCKGKGLTTQEWINRFNIIHNNIYDYSKFIYIKSNIKSIIICRKHGDFLQNPTLHYLGQNCPKCIGRNRTDSEWIANFNIKHKNRYDYSLFTFISSNQKATIICRKHGEFQTQPSKHKLGSGCPSCAFKNLNTENVLLNFKKIHRDIYDYSKVQYIKSNKKVLIICNKHGEFYQTPNSHLNGSGCPTCKESNGERKVRHWLEDNNFIYNSQYKFSTCKNKRQLVFDFYIPILNMVIEFQGEQHYKKMRYANSDDQFLRIIKNDNIKKIWCLENNVTLIEVSYLDDVSLILKRELL